MSLRKVDKIIAKRRQVYKAVLDNPFTNEAHMWPHVNEQQFVWELLESSILDKAANLTKLPLEEWPWDLKVDFNEIVKVLESQRLEVLLFVCNKDAMVPSVLLQQLPLMCQMSECDVTLVQLPRGTLQSLQKRLPYAKDGLLLLVCNEKLNNNFIKQIKSRVSKLDFPWLDSIKYQPTSIGLVKTTMPLSKGKR